MLTFLLSVKLLKKWLLLIKWRKMVHSWPFLKERLQVDRLRARKI
jgi:hypothetical protein